MSDAWKVFPLKPFTRAELLAVASGYASGEAYLVEKSESAERVVFDFRLVRLEKPFHADFIDDFNPEECEGYLNRLPRGYSFGAYLGERLVGFALGEDFPEQHYARVWEFHVHKDYQRLGIGRALMTRVIEKARADGLKTLMLETQNTNVSAVRFYRSMGFRVESIDLSPPHYDPQPPGEPRMVAFYLRRGLVNQGIS